MINYKSFKPVIKNDNDLYDDLKDLTDEVDQLFLLGYKIRLKQNLSIELQEKIDGFDFFCTACNTILSENGNYPVSTNSEILSKYMKLVNNILEEIQKIEKGFKIPIEDWSKDKRENYKFIIDDIKIKINDDIKTFNSFRKVRKDEIINTISGTSKNKNISTITVDNLRVREEPNLNAEKIENLAIGSKIILLAKSKNQTTVIINNNEITEYWYKIKTQSGNIGWIHGCCFDK